MGTMNQQRTTIDEVRMNKIHCIISLAWLPLCIFWLSKLTFGQDMSINQRINCYQVGCVFSSFGIVIYITTTYPRFGICDKFTTPLASISRLPQLQTELDLSMSMPSSGAPRNVRNVSGETFGFRNSTKLYYMKNCLVSHSLAKD